MKSQKNPIVVFDLDGVLLDFESAWKACAEFVLRKPIIQVSRAFPLEDRFGLTPAECSRVWEAFDRGDWWERVSPYEDAWEVVGALDAMRASIWAITNVDAQWGHARTVSLEGMIPSGRIITLGSHATPAQRARVLCDLGATVFVDDLPDNANAALPHVALSVHLNRGYADMADPEYGVTVIDQLDELPNSAEGIFQAYEAVHAWEVSNA